MAIYFQATTVTLAAIVACQDGNVFACRSERISIFCLGFFSNRLIWLGIAVEAVITHNAGIAAMADRVVTMRSGQITNVQRNETKVTPAQLKW